MLSRFPSVTEHVSSKLPSPVNCLNSPIYTSQYLARVLLPCQFSLHSFILPVNYFLVLPNHPTSLIHFGFYCWTPFSFSKRFLRLNTLLYSTLVSCRLSLHPMWFHQCTCSHSAFGNNALFLPQVCTGGRKQRFLHHHYEMEVDLTVHLWPAAISVLAHLNIFPCSTSWSWLLNLH